MAWAAEARRRLALTDETIASVFGLRRGAEPREPRKLDRYSNFVWLAKRVFPGVALAILLLAVFWPNISGTKKQIANTVKDTFSVESMRNFEMLSPAYFSTDEKNRPYKLEAKSAQQAEHNAEALKLNSPKAQVRMKKGNWVTVSARQGEYTQKKQLLVLKGNVYLTHDANYTFKTEWASVNLKDKTAYGNKPVVAKGPKGTIEAQGFRVLDKGATVIFTGKTRVVLHLNKQDMRELSGSRNVTE